MDWGSERVERFGSFQVNLGNTVNTYVRKPADIQKWEIVHWRFRNEDHYKVIREQLNTILKKR